MRLVRLPSGEVCYDYAQQRHGRGGYVCPESACLRKAFKGRHTRFGLNPKDLGSLVVEMRARLKEEILRTLERGKKRRCCTRIRVRQGTAKRCSFLFRDKAPRLRSSRAAAHLYLFYCGT
jgi:predicted RNA-binding protein YlxR (DUF448 family)